MLKNPVQQGHPMEAPEEYLRRYVEDAFEGRMKLAGFFSILLKAHRPLWV
jgi:hypothetical protein